MHQLSTRVLVVPLILLCVHGYLCGQDVIPRINNGFEIIHQPWHLVEVPSEKLPWATYDPATGQMDGKNLTPGFEAMATRFGKVILRFDQLGNRVPLLLNKKEIRYQPPEMVELGNRGHYEYVRAADDRLTLRLRLVADWILQNLLKAEVALGKPALAEFNQLNGKREKQSLVNKGYRNEVADIDHNFFLFQYIEGRPALAPIPGTNRSLAFFWERELWSRQERKARFSQNRLKDSAFHDFHCQILPGVRGSLWRNKPRNPPISELGEVGLPDE